MLLLPRTMLFLSRFRRAQEGATVVEFAMVALPFFMLLYAIIDTALIFFATTTLENGIVAAARKIRIGEAQASGMTAAQFRTLVCNEISMLLACDARLGIDVNTFGGFGNVSKPVVLDAAGNLSGNLNFNPGSPGDVVVVRAFYTWPILTPTMGSNLSDMAGNNRLLEATMAFRNEPFGSVLGN